MSYSAHVRAVLRLGVPLMGGHLAQVAIGVTDTAMLGRYGVEALAAGAVGSGFFFVLFLMGTGFAWAVMPLVAKYDPEGDDVNVRRATRMGLWLSAAFGVLALPLMLVAGPLLAALGQPPGVVAGAQQYLTVVSVAIFPALFAMVLKSYLAALEHTQVVFWIMVASALLNVVANYAFIFGNFGAPEMGIAGAALASVLTHVIMLVGCIIYVVNKLPKHDIFRRLWKPDWEMLAHVYRLGWPIGLTSLSEVAFFYATQLMVGLLGVVALASHAIVLQIASITFMLHLGLSNVATIRAGNALAYQDRTRLARGAKVVIAMSVAFAILTMIAFVLFPEPLILLFMAEDEPAREAVLATGVILLAIAALFQLVDGAQVVALGLLRGVQDTQVPMIIAAVSYWLIGIPVSYMLGFEFGMGAQGVWFGLVIGLAAAGLALMWRFWRQVIGRVMTGSLVSKQ